MIPDAIIRAALSVVQDPPSIGIDLWDVLFILGIFAIALWMLSRDYPERR